jgi:hypothetical protein
MIIGDNNSKLRVLNNGLPKRSVLAPLYNLTFILATYETLKRANIYKLMTLPWLHKR